MARLSAIPGGAVNHPLYKTWTGIRSRCNSPTCKAFPEYGGRGLKVDPRWDSFEVFLSDMGDCPEGMSLDRVDNSMGYYPDNCRWATPKQQANNRRNNVLITYDGVTKTMAQWAETYGIKKTTLHRRISYGWSIEDALNRPLRHRPQQAS